MVNRALLLDLLGLILMSSGAGLVFTMEKWFLIIGAILIISGIFSIFGALMIL